MRGLHLSGVMTLAACMLLATATGWAAQTGAPAVPPTDIGAAGGVPPAVATLSLRPPDTTPLVYADDVVPALASGEDLLVLGLGWTNAPVSGNYRYFDRYVTVANGVYPSLFRIYHPVDQHGVFSDITGIGFGGPSPSVSLAATDIAAGVWGDALYRRSSRYADYGDDATPLRRYDFQGESNASAFGGLFDASLFSVGVSGGNGDDAVDWHSNLLGAGYTHSLGEYYGRLGVDTQRFVFDVGPQLSGRTNSTSLTLTPANTDRTLVEAQLEMQRTELDGLTNETRSHSAMISANTRANDNLLLSGQLSTDSIYEPIVRNNYGRQRTACDVEAVYTGIKRTDIDASWEDARIAYVDTFQNYTSHPRWETERVKVTCRPGKEWRLVGSVCCRTLTGAPPSQSPATGTAGPIILWSDSCQGKFDLSYSPGIRCGWNAWWESNRYDNDFIGSRTRVDIMALAHWRQIAPKLVGNITWLKQGYDLRGLAPTTMAVGTSDANAITVGGTYQVDPHTTVDASWDWSRTTGETSLREEYLTLDLRRDLGQGNRLSVGTTLDRLTDFDGTGLGYSGDIFRAELTRDF